MPKVTMVQHINVQITNRQRTQEWYENVLGARFRDRDRSVTNVSYSYTSGMLKCTLPRQTTQRFPSAPTLP
jgi:hypothetical protein